MAEKLNRRDVLRRTMAAVALPLAACRDGGEVSLAATKPNIILCMADDQGWGDTGYNGHPYLKTPHLDEMSQAGLRFDRFYSGAPVCSPTRGSALTGRHPYDQGYRTGPLRKGPPGAADKRPGGRSPGREEAGALRASVGARLR